MRLRYVKGSKELIAAHEAIVHDPKDLKGRWHEFFGNSNPIRLEIGMGKGKFLSTLAMQNPDVNYIGIEKYEAVILRALEKKESLELKNLALICDYASELGEIFAEGEIDMIYLNFSDPWPKDRHAKRRLTSDNFLEVYKVILKKGGKVQFKTDNTALFDYSVERALACGYDVPALTRDLHASEFAEGNVCTEYEEKFVAEGKKICFMQAQYPCK